MNKADFITLASQKAELTKKDMTLALDAILETITDTLSKGDSVSFIGFGTFSTSQRAAREGVNPSTGAKLQIAATTVAKFKTGAVLKKAVNEK